MQAERLFAAQPLRNSTKKPKERRDASPSNQKIGKASPLVFFFYPIPPTINSNSLPSPSVSTTFPFECIKSTPQYLLSPTLLYHHVVEAACVARVWSTIARRQNHLSHLGRWLTRLVSRQMLLLVVCIRSIILTSHYQLHHILVIFIFYKLFRWLNR